MRKDLTDITVILDRSGSMSAYKAEAEGGLNHFIEEQKKLSGECLFTLCQFDTEYEFVHRGVPIKDVLPFTLVPRGWTALLDAIGRSINETGTRLAAMSEDTRPALVIFVIVTDGQENSSKEFSKTQIRQMVTEQQEKYSWKFTYLGANQNAFTEAGALGIAAQVTANYRTAKAAEAFNAITHSVSRTRGASYRGISQPLNFTPEERESME